MFDLKIIAKIKTDFSTKFGVPRQSGLAKSLVSTIVFEPEYRVDSALNGLEGFSHLWILWYFSESDREGAWSPTVRPPKLGGNKKVGVFASRSPFRPNPIGLSCVKIEGFEKTENGTVIKVSGADLMDGTPIFDIKPYLPFCDLVPDAVGGYTEVTKLLKYNVNFPENLISKIPTDKRDALTEVLSLDPRPGYQHDETRVYGFEFDGFDVKFIADGTEITIVDVVELK